MKLDDWASYYGYSAAWKTLGLMPDRKAYRIFEVAADRAHKKRGPSVVQFEKNLKRVEPDLNRRSMNDLLNAALRSHARYWCQLFLMSKWSNERFLDVDVEGIHHVTDSIESGTGSICVGAHAGNYDHTTAYFATEHNGVTAVTERLNPEKLFKKFSAIREAKGIEVIPTGTPDILDVLASRIEQGRTLALMGDRDLSKKGIPVTFFGEETRMPAGPALLGYRTGANLIPLSFFYKDGQTAVKAYDPVRVNTDLDETTAVKQATQQLADKLAVGIKEHPEDWHMLQRLWLTDLGNHRLRS